MTDGRGMVARSRGGALTWVPVYSTYGGREIAAVRAPRPLRGGSRRVRAGAGVLGGRARAGQGGAGASQVPPWPLPRANMRACDVSNLGDTYEIVPPVGVMGSGPWIVTSLSFWRKCCPKLQIALGGQLLSDFLIWL
jgi:hypothetical protein